MFEREKKIFDEFGFVVVREFLDPNSLAELKENIDRYIREVVPTLPDNAAFYQDRNRPETLKQMQHMSNDPFFAGYVSNPKWKQLADELIGEPSNSDQPEWFNKPPKTRHITPPHQDNFYFSLSPPNVLTIWLALDPVDTENGCLRFVERSHLKGFRPHSRSQILGFSQGINNYSSDDFNQEVPVILQPGDAVVHHGMTIHRADANISNTRHRRSFAMVFRGQSAKRDEKAYARYLESARAQHQELGLKI